MTWGDVWREGEYDNPLSRMTWPEVMETKKEELKARKEKQEEVIYRFEEIGISIEDDYLIPITELARIRLDDCLHCQYMKLDIDNTHSDDPPEWRQTEDHFSVKAMCFKNSVKGVPITLSRKLKCKCAGLEPEPEE